ncbi:C40 family peptidase [Nocardia cyriacigeorgica]|uniref:C40 family peptidase n=1 Tax=Nocardia cyriacigeorgica TaxID=135487 RepID=UPI0013D13D0F|nr:NlpC/P60 family protein [Nocardia cyriacigeorgica]MBF6439891.1 C40 family peptidase [Nocardia cyriacigeorgica]MBF6455919.1 C40 family peptidase [Nocardia cyriacigeorgica]MBF6479350.1 C40 family peptidase [Nocardia cyriacigeorgica]MBF6553340.1 C40 family peptidase [Nocardia cyriacigeorgica]NEW29021.1 peptidase P60 [Nocardia cyriacigeorgica]
MAPGLTTDAEGVLRSLAGLYGEGQPTAGTNTALAKADLAASALRGGHMQAGYSEARTRHESAVEAHAGRAGVVDKAVAGSGDGTVLGRRALDREIAEFHSRVKALSTLGDLRFSGPALLDSAQKAVTNATKQVNGDLDAARRQAAQIVPPEVPKSRVRGQPPIQRRRRRRPSRGRASGGIRRSSADRRRVPSDGTRGGLAVSAASAWLGAPYIWGGGGPGGPTGGGFDCSGLTQYAIAQATNGEVILPRTTYDQIHSGVRVHPSDVQPGDLVFPGRSFSAPGVPEHVQLAAGNGMVIEAPTFGQTVTWSRMDSDSVVIRVL